MALSEREHWREGGVELTWDPSKRLIRMTLSDSAEKLTSVHAAAVTEQYDRWTGALTEPFGVCVDCRALGDADAGWRSGISAYHRRTAGRSYVTWFGPSPFVRVMLEMFLVATPSMVGKVVSHEAAALAWLREKGIG